jgi:5'-methylthioadenosine phosphorylase
VAQAQIGIIGGSGLYDMPGIRGVREVRVATPFGKPSDAYVLGELEGRKVAFLSRHGRGHVLTPSEINYRANIYGFKKLGVVRIVSVSAVGSLKEELKPLDMVLPLQFFDRTRGRISTFFGGGIVAHISFAHPVCPEVVEELDRACAKSEVRCHRGGTYVCMEGPAFSTQAESFAYRAWGMDVIGMTNLQEAKLAREAEICYATLAMVTDYDCWHTEHDAVTVKQVVEVLTQNVEHARKVIRAAVRAMPVGRNCQCGSALAHAILTEKKKIPAATKKRLRLLIGKYLK